MTINCRGYSLVELMVAVAIVGILTTLAIPRFVTFQAKARQGEAKQNLTALFMLERLYYADNNRYANLPVSGVGYNDGSGTAQCPVNDLGFYLMPCNTKVRYLYSTNASFDAYTASATSAMGNSNLIIKGCSSRDIWQIDHAKILKNTQNAIVHCN